MSPNAPHKIGLKSIVYLKKVEKYLRIGRKRKNKKVKKSGNSGFKEFPRPLDLIVSKEEHVYYIYKNNLFAIFFV